MTLLLVVLGGALGAPARYLTDRAVQTRHPSAFPWGTLVVNVAGSLVFGLLLGLAAHRQVPAGILAGLGTGFCGALTTWSTLGYETFALLDGARRRDAAVNLGLSIALGMGAGSLGYAVGLAR